MKPLICLALAIAGASLCLADVKSLSVEGWWQVEVPGFFPVDARRLSPPYGYGFTPVRVNPYTNYPECASWNGVDCLWLQTTHQPHSQPINAVVPYKMTCAQLAAVPGGLTSGCFDLPGGSLWPCDICKQASDAQTYQFTYFVNSDLHMGGTSDYAGHQVDIKARINDILGGIKTVMADGRARNPTGYVLNGDLTDFYQVLNGDDTVSDIYTALDTNGPAIPNYRGMGNHDFGNNIDDCTYKCGAGICWGLGALDKFGCAARAIRDLQWGNMKWWRQTTPSTLVALDSTSGAYHWRENGYSFIMLQRNPYESFGVRCYPPLPGNCGGGTTSCNCAGQYTYQLQSTIANGWLEGQLAAATSWGNKIILFTHQDECEATECTRFALLKTDPEFNQLVSKYSVVGLFEGHTHTPEWLGEQLAATPNNVQIPIVNSGASWYNMFLQVDFGSDCYSVKVREVSPGNPASVSMMMPGPKGPGQLQANNVGVRYRLAKQGNVWRVTGMY